MASPELESLRAAILAAGARSGSSGSSFDVPSMRAAARSPWPVPEDCRVRELDAGGVPARWLVPEQVDPGRRLLYLHGGGWVAGGFASHGAHAARIAASARCAVLLPEFRLAPEHPHPAALDDALACYRFLVDQDADGAPTTIRPWLGGDSGGGGLSLALLLLLRDGGETLPSAVFTFSAVADLTLAGESMRTRAEVDPLINPEIVPQAVAMYLDGADPRDPLVSPVFGDFTGLPPLLLQVGDEEVFLDDSRRVAEIARRDGVEVTLEVWPELFHGFQLWAPVLPEGRQALERVAAFLRRL